MAQSKYPSSFGSSDEFDTVLSRTTVHAFRKPSQESGFLDRLELARKVKAALPGVHPAILVLLPHSASTSPEARAIGAKLTVGRMPSQGWNVEDPQKKLSSTHFEITSVGGGYLFTDLKSTNGSRLNENPGKIARCDLLDGDMIVAGGLRFMFLEACTP